jgi:hypothetical protein
MSKFTPGRARQAIIETAEVMYREHAPMRHESRGIRRHEQALRSSAVDLEIEGRHAISENGYD